MNPFFAMFNGWEVVAIFAIILVLFGAKKLPELAKGLGQGIKEFKKSSREIQDDLNNAMDMDTPPPAPRQQISPQKTDVHVAGVVPDATHPTSGQPKA